MKLIYTSAALALLALPAVAAPSPAPSPTVFPTAPEFVACLEQGARWDWRNERALDAEGGCKMKGEVFPDAEEE